MVSAAAEIPTNLMLVVQALSDGGAIFDLGEPTASGEQSMLDRLVALAPFMRSFIKHARVQEGILSPATLNNLPKRMSRPMSTKSACLGPRLGAQAKRDWPVMCGRAVSMLQMRTLA